MEKREAYLWWEDGGGMVEGTKAEEREHETPYP